MIVSMIFKIINLVRRFQNTIYSTFIKLGFKSAGKNFFIEYPSRLVGGEAIEVGDNFYCYGGLRLEAYRKHNGFCFSPSIKIGDNVSFNFDCHIGCISHISIGNNVLIASKVFITDHYHGDMSKEDMLLPPAKRKIFSKGPVVIEDNVWIGEGVAIMPNVTIGKNSIIGANAVVTKSFPENSIIAGIPAKQIKKNN
jgi:acetyltransferase-like isoleucine patch superfamily enzyme